MKYYCVISHTHWDREWYQPFEEFRLRLVNLVDNLLDIVGKYPEYIFHLDAQTVVLEDYLEIRPQKRNILIQLIKKGNIIIGPWYLQNDFYLTSGESTVRNLIYGKKMTEEFGASSKIGYAPDQFGNVGQLPQILNNFGVDTFVFGRGYSDYIKNAEGNPERRLMPSEFKWKGADGSELLAVHMTYWYNNAQRFSEDIEKVKILLNCNFKAFKDIAVTPYILMMNGVDHLEAQDNLLPILDRVNQEIEDVKIRQYTLDEYLDTVKKYISDNDVNLTTFEGPLNKGGDYELLRGCWSSRCYLKKENVKAQDNLEHRIEPLYAAMTAKGFKGVFDKDYIDYMWKCLMKNHPHDSICGCSRDEVHFNMENNFVRLGVLTKPMLERGFKLANEHFKTAYEADDNYSVLMFNASEKPLGGVIGVECTFVAKEKVSNFDIFDEEGNRLEYVVNSRGKSVKDVFSPINLPGVLEVDVFEIEVYVPEIKPFAFSKLSIVKRDGDVKAKKAEKRECVSNGFYTIETREGKVNITAGGKQICDAIRIEDCGDRGDSYVYNKTDEAPIYASLVKVSAERRGLGEVMNLTYALDIPDCYDFENGKRSHKKIKTEIKIILTLEKGAKTIKLDYRFMNASKEHRLRLLFNSGIQSEVLLCDSAFDVVENKSGDNVFFTMSDSFCGSTFGAVRGGGRAFGLYTEGQHEIERMGETLAVTVLRSTGVISRGMHYKSSGGKVWDVPANQVLREVNGRLGLQFENNEMSNSDLYTAAKQFRIGLQANFFSMSGKKFMGGRTAVQDAAIEELFYQEDKYPGALIDNEPVFKLSNPGVTVSAFYEGAEGLVLRLVNLNANEADCRIDCGQDVYGSDMAESKCQLLGSRTAQLKFMPKEIKTLVLKQI